MSSSKDFESPKIRIAKAEIKSNIDSEKTVNLTPADIVEYREHMFRNSRYKRKEDKNEFKRQQSDTFFTNNTEGKYFTHINL